MPSGDAGAAQQGVAAAERPPSLRSVWRSQLNADTLGRVMTDRRAARPVYADVVARNANSRSARDLFASGRETARARMRRLVLRLSMTSWLVGAWMTGCSGTTEDAGRNETPATCGELCAKLAEVACKPGAPCGCDALAAEASQRSCDAQWTSWLTCITRGNVTCDPSGEPIFDPCSSQWAAYSKCLNPPPPGCESVPYPAGATECLASGTGDSCMEDCTDGTHHWFEECQAGMCSCKYDGKTICTCAGVCDCCPG